MSKAQIVGSMLLPDDLSDSSESEDEVELFVENKPPKGAETAPAFSAPVSIAKASPGGLLGAMTAAVNAIEGRSVDAESEPTPAPVADSFGIVYKPIKRKTENTNVKAMSFEDEKEFEKELNLAGGIPAAPATVAGAEDDDEFDLDMDAAAVEGAPALADILSRVASQPESVPAEPEPAADFNTAVWANSTGEASTPLEIESGASVLQSSRSALADIKSAYAGGHGDVEVRLLDAAAGQDAGARREATTVIPLHQLKDITVIEEGDEEEEEEEEEREKQQKAEETRQEERLEAQWSGVAESGAAGEEDGASALEMEFDAAAGAAATGHAPVPASPAHRPLSYQECLGHLMDANLAQYESLIVVEEHGASSSGFGGLFGGNAKLAFAPCRSRAEGGASAGVSLEAQRLPFLLAQVDYDSGDAVHYRALCTLYAALCGGSGGAVPPAVSPLWEDLGFQGVDPRTDLNRAMKMLAVLQALHLLETYPELARQCYAISESYVPNRSALGSSTSALRADPTKDVSWPFMCVSLMFTREALQALRSGALNAKCNKHGQILAVLHDFHHALFHQFHSLLAVTNKQTPIVHHAEHLAAMRKQCSKAPLSVLKGFKAYKQLVGDAGGKRAEVPAPAVRVPSSSGAATAKPTSTKPAAKSAPDDEQFNSFANLDAVADAEEEVAGADDIEPASSSSSWGNILSMNSNRPTGKAAKFAV